MTQDDLAAIGNYLYGEFWQSELARALDINSRTIRGYLSGRWQAGQGVVGDIIQLAAAKQVSHMLPFYLEQREHFPEGILELYVYTSGKVASPYKRTWSAETDLAIKRAMVPILAEHGIKAIVVER